MGKWLERRRPAPPGPLVAELEIRGIQGDSVWSALTQGSLEELRSAIRRTGRVRESAFHLLAADALLTYACEAAIEDEDPRARLVDLVDAVGGALP